MIDYVYDDNGTEGRVPGAGVIEGNTSTTPIQSTHGGGGVFVYQGAVFTLDNGFVRENISNSVGGGVALRDNASLIMRGGEIYENEALDGSGGGVHGNASSIMTMYGGEIYENETNSNGGGVAFHASQFSMSGGYIYDNDADSRGGGVRLNDSIFNMSGGTIRGNTASPAAGGVDVDLESTFTMTGGVIGGNLTAHANSAASGGGVWVGGQSSFYMLPGTITVEGITTLTYGRILGNVATSPTGLLTGGGGVQVVGLGSQFTMRAGVIGGDAENNEGNTAHRGGGVHVSGPAIFRMEAGSINVGGTPTATSGSISGNHAVGVTSSDGGGGVFMFHVAPVQTPNQRAQFFLEAGTIGGSSYDGESNIGQHGGGVFVHSDSTLAMDGGRISGNVARACGGGINLGANTRDNNLIMRGGTIGGSIDDGEGNIAGTDGGGVRVGINSTFEMEGGRIVGNEAVNGGGVVVLTDSVFNMRAGAIGSEDDPDYGNTAVTGGGVSVGLGWIEGIASATSFNMYGGTIGNNTADYGGGVYVNDNVTGNVFNLRGTNAKLITANEAEYDGGGVWVAEFAEMVMATTATSVSITYNIAGEMGGGIFTERYEYENPLTLIEYPLNPGGVYDAYSNLTLYDVYFNNNEANAAHVPPINATAVIPATAFDETSVAAHPLNNFDINFYGERERFAFFKTDYRLYTGTNPLDYLLPDAQFRVFRSQAPASLIVPPLGIGAAYLVTMDSSNNPNAPWEEVTLTRSSSSANTDAYIYFYMIPGFYYQIVEVLAPIGFQTPMGQWRVEVCEIAPEGFVVTPIGGGSIPPLIPIPPTLCGDPPEDCECVTVSWFVGNMRDFDLPLTGGLGIGAPVAAGAVAIVVAGVASFLIVLKRKRSVV